MTHYTRKVFVNILLRKRELSLVSNKLKFIALSTWQKNNFHPKEYERKRERRKTRDSLLREVKWKSFSVLRHKFKDKKCFFRSCYGTLEIIIFIKTSSHKYNFAAIFIWFTSAKWNIFHLHWFEEILFLNKFSSCFSIFSSFVVFSEKGKHWLKFWVNMNPNK